MSTGAAGIDPNAGLVVHPMMDQFMNRGEQDEGTATQPPCLMLHYMFRYPFNHVVMGYLKKYNYEPRQSLSTITGVE